MRILVTGGAGFIGSHLVDALLARGDRVVVLDNLNDYYAPAIKKRNLTTALQSDRFTFVEGDILDESGLTSLFDRHAFDVVVHLAARAGVRPSLKDPQLYERVNCQGTLNLLAATVRQKTRRFVFASSSSVYGNAATPPFKETEKIDRPISPYGATKAAGELYCHTYHHLYGLSVTALRFFTAYGPRQRPDMAIHKFTALIDAGQPVPFYGDGATERDYTYIADIVGGVLAAVDRDLGFATLNLGESQTTRLAQLVAIIEDKLGKKANLDRMPMQPGDVQHTYADIGRARTLLDYAPATGVEQGIEHFVDWFRKMKAEGLTA